MSSLGGIRSAVWNDYEIIASGGGEKLERWGSVLLLRPDPQAIWQPPFKLSGYKGLNAVYNRESSGGGAWTILKPFKDEWTIGYKDLKFLIKPMGFKHTGLFPEQSVNWDYMRGKIEGANRPVTVLNLFAYTGGATVACLKSGASVTHVDASKGMVDRASDNIRLNGLAGDRIRYIIDDCRKFVIREAKRGKKYDAIVLDPPSYGRGSGGEMWKLENDIYSFLQLLPPILSENKLFVLLNSYTTGLQPATMQNLMRLCIKGASSYFSYEVTIKSGELDFPCGATSVAEFS